MRTIFNAAFVLLFLFTVKAGVPSTQIKADSVTGTQGSQVTVAVRTFGFSNILSMQGTIQFDTSVIKYDTVMQFGLPQMTISDIGTAQAAAGKLTYLWYDQNLTGISVADSTALFEIVFDVVGSFGEQSSICFVNSPTQLEVIDTNYLTVAVNYVCGNAAVPGASLPVATISSTNITCFGAGDGTASVSVLGGAPSYTYLWTNGDTTASTSSLDPGLHSVIVTDFLGFSDTASVTIGEPALLTASVNATNASTCTSTDGSATALVSGGTPTYNYNWSNGGTIPTISGLAPGSYSVTVTDFNNCTASDTAQISQSASQIVITISSSNVSCFGGNNGTAKATATLGNAPYSYAWSNSATTDSISNLSVGSLTVTATDQGGCTATQSVTITEPGALIVSISSTNTSGCTTADGSATATASGGTTPYDYLWSNNATTATISNVTANDYTVTVTDANNCVIADSITVNQTSSLTVAIPSSNDAKCNGGSSGTALANATMGSAPYTYAWSNGATTAQVSNLSAGSHTVTATDQGGCTATATVTISEPVVISVTTTVVNQVSCFGGNNGSATANATGGTTPYSYAWSNGETNATAVNLTAGSKAVTVTDANNCAISSAALITQPSAALAISKVVTPVSSSGASDGAIDLTVSGGTLPYTYSWSNSSTTQDISNLAANTYTVTVTDSKGCMATDSTVVSESVSVPLLNSSNGVKIYPNPNKGNFEIDLGENMNEDLQISVINTMGQVIFEIDDADLIHGKANVQLMPSMEGTFILKLVSADQTRWGRFVILQ